MPNIVYSAKQRKPVVCFGTSHADIKQVPAQAQRQFGHDLADVQRGLTPRDWKPMTSIGSGVRELRVRIEGTFRLIYVATLPESVYVLHVFQKKSRKTARADLHLARARLAHVLTSRTRG